MAVTIKPVPGADKVRQQIHRTLERYFALEAQLQQLEKDRFRVCIFGSARIRPDDPTYQTVYDLAKLLTELNIDIVTGGGPGLMEAANKAVRDVNNEVSQSIGLTIYLPKSHELANRHLDIKSEHKRFSTRLDEFMRLSHAVIVAPGGIGTLLELVYVWQLIQVGMIEPRCVVLLGCSYWNGLTEWVRETMLGRGFISPQDVKWLHCVEDPEHALPFIKEELEKFRAQVELKPDGDLKAEQASRIIGAIEQKESAQDTSESASEMQS
jgi:uncharacterized protein (TIGR00730 family)